MTEIQRKLDVAGDNVTIIDIESYYSIYRYGSTQKIYYLKDENTVIKIRIGNESPDFDITVKVNIFDANISDESIQKWINNQHSDALYTDAPEPIGVYSLPEDSYSVSSYNLVDHTVEHSGDEYDNYVLEIYVDNVSEEGIYNLKSFVAKTAVHIRTKDIN